MALQLQQGYGTQSNREPPLSGLSPEEKLAYAAFHLEQHEQSMKSGNWYYHQH